MNKRGSFDFRLVQFRWFGGQRDSLLDKFNCLAFAFADGLDHVRQSARLPLLLSFAQLTYRTTRDQTGTPFPDGSPGQTCQGIVRLKSNDHYRRHSMFKLTSSIVNVFLSVRFDQLRPNDHVKRADRSIFVFFSICSSDFLSINIIRSTSKDSFSFAQRYLFSVLLFDRIAEQRRDTSLVSVCCSNEKRKHLDELKLCHTSSSTFVFPHRA